MSTTVDTSPKTEPTPSPKTGPHGESREDPRGEQLWAEYERDPGDASRNALIEHYQKFLGEVVRRFARRLPRSVDRGDLQAASNLGLISAIASFDPERNIRFEAYADLRVRGALLDELRAEDWLPRPWRQRVEVQKRCAESLRSKLGREPHDAEIAEAMELSLPDYQRYFGVGLPGSISGAGDGGDGPSILDFIPDPRDDSPGEELTQRELLTLVTQRLSGLEIRLVYLKYWEDLAMREIGDLIGISESRVCKIHSALLLRLRSRFRVDESVA